MHLVRRTVLGLDVGGTKTACVEGTVDARILQRVEMPTRATEPFARTFPAIAERTRALIDEAGRAGRTLSRPSITCSAICLKKAGDLASQEGFYLGFAYLPHLK